MTCEEVRIALGAHALGALDPEEALEVDHHLATCEACGAELVELEGVGSFLGKVSERDVELVASPPRRVLDRLLNDRVKRARRGRILMAVAASAAVLVVGGTVWTAIQARSVMETSSSAQAPAVAQSANPESRAQQDQGSALVAPLSSEEPSRSPEARSQPSKSPASRSQTADKADEEPAEKAEGQADTAATRQPGEGREFPGVNKAEQYRATVLALPSDTGTELGVQVGGVPVGTVCRLVVVAADGRREETPTWVVSRQSYQDNTVFRQDTTLALREIVRFEVVDQTGRLLVNVPVPEDARK
ncbi:hypothetical protein GCM10022224_093140 [Nonomuraea antimicrobica]|uniref:Putative zinc-finger domain-containing protein n=1 Tax=Nonomuraea antimicrobica TaxID=561173 RepID=A0ABP7E1R0_9ACTN